MYQIPRDRICISDTVEAAEQFRRIGTTIDYLHIDQDNTADGRLRDFEAYLPQNWNDRIVTFHDTRPNAHTNTTCWNT